MSSVLTDITIDVNIDCDVISIDCDVITIDCDVISIDCDVITIDSDVISIDCDVISIDCDVLTDQGYSVYQLVSSLLRLRGRTTSMQVS